MKKKDEMYKVSTLCGRDRQLFIFQQEIAV